MGLSKLDDGVQVWAEWTALIFGFTTGLTSAQIGGEHPKTLAPEVIIKVCYG